MPPATHVIINALGFQAAWWVLIVSVDRGLEAPAIALCLALAAIHLYANPRPSLELRLAAASCALGICLDTLLQDTGVITFRGWALGPLSPFWLWTLWALFGLTLNASMAFLLSRHWGLSVLLGGVFGPLSYLAGGKLEAASFTPSLQNLAALALAWMVAMPLLVVLARRWQQTAEAPAPVDAGPATDPR
jgi:hypothetical protein